MRVRPQEFADRYRQFVGRQEGDAETPIPVALWQDGRGISSREAAPYTSFAVADGGPAAGNHTIYRWTPRTPSRELLVRMCWLKFGRETSTAIIGVRVGAATTTAVGPTTIIELDDSTDARLELFECTNANLPALSLFNWFAATDPPAFAYPEYFIEFRIPPNQVLEIMSRTQDDTLNASGGYYTLPIV